MVREDSIYIKGADAVMTSIAQYSDWLEEEVYTVTCTHIT